MLHEYPRVVATLNGRQALPLKHCVRANLLAQVSERSREGDDLVVDLSCGGDRDLALSAQR